jgi:hypothetical protein
MARQAGGGQDAGHGADRDGLDFIREEYFFLQQTVEDYQKQSLDIKKLSIGLSAGLAILKGVTKADLVLSLASILLLALGFWLLDWLWKEFQRNHYPRIDDIEAELGREMRFPPRLSASWRHAGDTRHRAPVAEAGVRKRALFEWKTAFWPQVFIPHLPIAVICVAALVFVFAVRQPPAAHAQASAPAAAEGP